MRSSLVVIVGISLSACTAVLDGPDTPGDPWNATPFSGGQERLVNRHTGLCLQEIGDQAVAAACSAARSQLWQIAALAPGIHMLRNVQSGRCLHSHLDVDNGRPHIFACNPAWWSTHFVFTGIGSSHVQLRGRHTGVCLGSDGSYQNRLAGSVCNSGWWSQHWSRQSPAPTATGPIPGGLLSLDFDDNCTTHHSVTAPLLEQQGLRGTFYLLSASTILHQGHIDLPQGGHEVGAHTINHPDLTSLSDKEVILQLEQSRDVLANTLQVSVDGFASPFGYYDQRTLSHIRPRFRFHRTTDVGLNFPGSDIYRLRAHSIGPSVTPQQVRALIDEAINRGGWRILLFHCLSDTSPDYPVWRFQQVLAQVKSSGIRVVTASEGVNVLQGL